MRQKYNQAIHTQDLCAESNTFFPSRCRILHGFTLIELLVVISIIALLLSIMMPALAKAREQARRVVCASNQRQILSTFSLYAHSNRGKFPHSQREVWPNHLTPANQHRRADQMYRMPWLSVYGYNYSFGYRLIDAGYADAKLFDCPSKPKYPNGGAEAAPYTVFFYDMSRYGENLPNWNLSGYEFRVFRYSEANTSELLRDSTPFSSKYEMWNGGNVSLFDMMSFSNGIVSHVNGANLGYADGSVGYDNRYSSRSELVPMNIKPTTAGQVALGPGSIGYVEMCRLMDRGGRD